MSLSTVAQIMRQNLEAEPRGSGKEHRILFGGLHIVMERNGEAWRLAIGRDNVYPSQKEIEIIARDFNLPDGLVWTNTVVEQRSKHKDKTIVTKWHVSECVWAEPTKEMV